MSDAATPAVASAAAGTIRMIRHLPYVFVWSALKVSSASWAFPESNMSASENFAKSPPAKSGRSDKYPRPATARQCNDDLSWTAPTPPS